MPPSSPDVAFSVRAFSADLYRRLAGSSGNLVVSPYSVATALGMTLAGARGETAEQIARVLRGPADGLAAALGGLAGVLTAAAESDDGVLLDLANAVWAQDGPSWDEQFLGVLESDYKTALQQVDFRTGAGDTVRMINSWVAERTHDKINELFSADQIDQLTRLVLVNAAYFKAAWKQPFRGRTRDRRFSTADGNQVEVPTMAETVRQVGHREGDGWQAVQLDFVGDRMAMALVLPDGPIGDLEAGLDDQVLGEFLEPFAAAGSLQVLLPKWRFRLRRTLNGDLAGLGMPLAFDRDQADFSGMTADQPLAISTVVQEAFVAVDEEGAEAAAATGVAMVTRAAVARPRTIAFDRPFLFLIFDRQTRVPLFIGRVSDPSRG